MDTLRAITAHDRYQASLGINAAAHLVADRASALGLDEVRVDHFPADGARRWWSFRAPLSWTPTVARFEVIEGDRRLLSIDHASQPFSIATYSAATPAGGVRARLWNVRTASEARLGRGGIAVIERADYLREDILSELVASGVRGFVTDATARSDDTGEEFAGRIELPPGSTLFGFSVTPRQLSELRRWADAGLSGRADVVIDTSASMPVVSALIPGEAGGELWLTSHLCHPRPGANDNASGSAGLLEVARLQQRARTARGSQARRSIRFIWGPEFLGVAAYLSRHLELNGRSGAPWGVINLDMIGESQLHCGSPFLLERSPDFIPSLITPLAEYFVNDVFTRTRAEPGTWQAAPFVGFSDHALFSAGDHRCPAVQFCHVPDRFNHSAADTVDKVSRLEMARSIAAATALAEALAGASARPTAAIRAIVSDWVGHERAAARRFCEEHRGNGEDWIRGYLAHVDTTTTATLALLDPGAALEGPRANSRRGAALPGVGAAWRGPFNARAMLEDVSPRTRAVLMDQIRNDKMTLALLLNLAVRSDGTKPRQSIITETAYSLRRTLPQARADQLFDALLESGWISEGLGTSHSEVQLATVDDSPVS
jgi:peptidase M28-like protein